MVDGWEHGEQAVRLEGKGDERAYECRVGEDSDRETVGVDGLEGPDSVDIGGEGGLETLGLGGGGACVNQTTSAGDLQMVSTSCSEHT